MSTSTNHASIGTSPVAIFTRIQELLRYEALRPAEVAVAHAILASPNKVVRGNIEELSAQARVSTTSVIRFCRNLGFQGFKDFKIALALEQTSIPAVLEDEINLSDNALAVMTKVLRSEMQALEDTLVLMDEATVERAVELLQGANRIEIYGMGSSFPIVTDAYYRLLRIGLRVSTPPDTHMQAVNASLLRAGDVALVISHTGRTQEIVTTASLARRAGASVIALTSFSRSPLLEHADVALVTAVRETSAPVEAMASRLAHLAVIDALYVTLASRGGDDATESLAKTRRAIDEQRSDFD